MLNLANFLTILSLICGFTSVIFSLEKHFTFACWAILLSVILDGLDGQVARKITHPTEFGKELDSLVDVVTFGIAPSILGYIFVYQEFHLLATLSLLVYLITSVIRLAMYNVTHKEELKYVFYGLPTTMSGGILTSFILLYRRYMKLPPPAIFLFLVLLLAFLMVSHVRYLNLDGLKKVLGKSLALFLAVVFTAGVMFHEVVIFVIFLIYLIFSPFLVRKIVYNTAK